ncbi:serine/threonine-protein kinase [Candidatus Mycoplasma mahonii]|uniref:serine/threonine-protein kinase n=1 Tax=Candidatus Mycoplasma mahonii TaxID=3004105 RepID=UPI0026EACA3F|nr:serine/threonine-protein kinase [Candidatus Mycoplasma mahonii]WKX02719.1 serine/threonine-protein kinase [Candidatus Mycoplasma mahonii]
MIELLKDKFDIIREIGSGGMAKIFLAKDKVHEKEVAIKILIPDKKNSYVAKKRFKSEMELTQKVNSPYVIKIFDAVWEDDLQYIVMEYAEGEILKNYIEKRTRLTVDETIEFMKQLTLGFEEIHSKNIIHRDVKSSNAMVTLYGGIKIIDFGIALTEGSERLTKTDNVIGSVHYIAPEIINQEEPTLQSDIYALGILMYEMLTGEVPFKEANPLKTALKHKSSNVPHVNKSFKNIPQSVANIVIKATSKNRKNRYKTMYDFYKDLTTSLSKTRLYEEVISFGPKRKKSFTKIINSPFSLGVIITVFVFLLIIFIVLLVVLVI